MSKYFEYNNKYYKISISVLKVFDVYTLEEYNLGINILCKELDTFLHNQEKNKMYAAGVIYQNSICDFSKLNTGFKDKLINKMLLELNSIKVHKYNSSTISKLNDYIED